MKKTSAPAGKSRMKYLKSDPDKTPAQNRGAKGVSGALSDPAAAGAMLGLLAALALLLLKDKNTDAGELLVLGKYIRDEFSSGSSFNWTGRSALIAGLLPGALLWSICKKRFELKLFPEESGNRFTQLIKTALCGIAGGALMMAGIQFSGFSVWAAFQKAMQLSGGAAVFLGSAAITAFMLSAAAGLIRRKKS